MDAVLADLDDVFDTVYAAGGRRSVPPEALLKATVISAVRLAQKHCEAGKLSKADYKRIRRKAHKILEKD